MAAEANNEYLRNYSMVVNDLLSIQKEYQKVLKEKLTIECDVNKKFFQMKEDHMKETQDLKLKISMMQMEITDNKKKFREKRANHHLYRYFNVVRNEIAKFDRYAWEVGFQYGHHKNKIERIQNYENKQIEKRKLRILYALKYSSEEAVKVLRSKLKHDVDQFANNLARGYNLISSDIHTLSYTSEFEGCYCSSISSDKFINSSIRLLMENVETKIGEMVQSSRKRKIESSESKDQ